MAACEVDSSPKALVYRGPAACSGCAESVADLLKSSGSKFVVDFAGPNEKIDITTESLQGIDLFAQPGGGDLAPAWEATKKYKDVIRNYVAEGGRYAGFCVGAYLAGPDQGFDLLPSGSSVAREVDQPGSQVPDERDTVIQVDWTFQTGSEKGQKQDGRWVYFQDGAVVKLAADAPGVVLGTYSSNGNVASSVTPFEKGWVGLVGPHPEADQSWYDLVNVTNPDGIKFDIGHDFVDSIMAQPANK
ncbi:hypothetical protein BGW36DRAFT_393017 [Talaromyces proteolyticus]|uniref:Biotin-protein ligase N-terminal domain-containing protein n=1 Tax=Talaromyces proteolyticus TaxID=1131652 RepID=A0AAD4L1G2_9EURO|nr:uncharacterized protein BGW36DRAFT_393017 [Talaromyces proteolyticus]KAH8705389.1 hypothetical protein BGW36DRAFT_393017 [Talaromyces proteolyticus]